MKRIILTCVTVMGLYCIPLQAYIPGTSIIRKCPGCGRPIEQQTTLSGNTIGARYWSDGKREAPMLPDRPWLVKCPACSILFWIDEAEEWGEKSPYGEPSEWGDLSLPDVPSEQDYYSMLENPIDDRKKERYLRLKAWWAFNDRYRDSVDAEMQLTPEASDNMEHLHDILVEIDPSDRIMKAEIARQLGRFEECIKLLDSEFPDDYMHAVSVIRNAAQNKETSTKEL